MDDAPLTFRWRLVGPPGPSLTLAVLLGEAVRAMVFNAAEARGLMPLPASFHGGHNAPHTHAHWLGEDEDGDGLVDHFILHAASGLPEKLIPALAEGGEVALRLATGERVPMAPDCWRLLPQWMGRDGGSHLLCRGRDWVTTTPFVTPLPVRREGAAITSVRPGRDIESQLCRELRLRGLPKPSSIHVEPGAAAASPWIGARGFARSRTGRLPPGDALAAQLRVSFAEPVVGPLALGFASHFGLGLLRREA